MPQERVVQPPRIAVWLVDQFTPYNQTEAIPGDLLEEFSDLTSRQGIASARRWYWRQSIRSIGHLIGDGLRVASWSIAASTLVACLLGWCLFRLTDTTANAVLSRYHVYYHVNPYVFWLAYGILIERLIIPMLMGGMVALAVRGRELVASITVSLFIGTLSGMFLVYCIMLAVAHFPSWYKFPGILLPQFVTTFLSPMMIIVGGIIVRKVRSSQHRLDNRSVSL
jgi:hypothetical protein